MITVLLAEMSPDWMDRVAGTAGGRALLLRADSGSQALDLAWSVRIGVLGFGLDPLTDTRLESYRLLTKAAPDAVTVCLAPAEVIEEVRREGWFRPDFWVLPEAPLAEVREIWERALDESRLRSRAGRSELPAEPAGPPPPAEEPPSWDSRLLQRMISGLASGPDLRRLLATYGEAVAAFAGCASYALLWREREGDTLSVFAAQGLPPEIVSQARLRPADCLPSWYRQNSRLLTRRELAYWSDREIARDLHEELELFRAQVALPLFVEGRLAGVMFLGDKAVGEPYSRSELETLFLLTNYVAAQAQSLELHAELQHSQAHLERILAGISTGVITMGPDGRIALCNPAAGRILEMECGELEGRDLRALPSPLGDYLQGALNPSGETVAGEEVSVRGGQLALRISTAPLLDEQGAPTGSVMLLEDLTPQIALATERKRRERLDLLNKIVGRLAHEVRTPLTAIRTYTELAGRAQSDPDLSTFWTQTVYPQIEQLESLISQLVQLVQQPEPNFELVRVEGLVEEAIRRVREGAGSGESAQVEMRVEGSLPRVVADPEPTRQALQYLMHYLLGDDRSAVEVRLAAEQTELGENVRVTMLRLEQNGKSPEPEALFDPFYVLQETGADLGPVISRRIIENQGGRVEANSEGGRLVFTLHLPASALDQVRLQEGDPRQLRFPPDGSLRPSAR